MCVAHSRLRVICDQKGKPRKRRRVTVRKSVDADLAVLRKIEQAAIWEHVRPEAYRPSGAGRKAWERLPAENLVAEVGNRVVGTAEYRAGIDPHEAPAVVVTDLGVLPEFQGMGVAGALVERIRRIGKREGFRKVYVSTTIDNLPAIAFHLKHGARVFHVTETDGKGAGRWGLPTRFDVAFVYEIA